MTRSVFLRSKKNFFGHDSIGDSRHKKAPRGQRGAVGGLRLDREGGG